MSLSAKMLYLRWLGGATSDRKNAIPLMPRLVDLWRQEWYTFDAEVGRPYDARVIYLAIKGWSSSGAEGGQPLIARLVDL